MPTPIAQAHQLSRVAVSLFVARLKLSILSALQALFQFSLLLLELEWFQIVKWIMQLERFLT